MTPLGTVAAATGAGKARPKPHLLTRGPIYRFMRHVFLYRLTDAGKLLFWVSVLAMGAGSTTLVMQIHQVFCACMGIFVASVVCARVARPTLRIEAEVPHATVAGQTLRLPIRITNAGPRAALDIVVGERNLPDGASTLPEAGVGCAYIAPGASWSGTRSLSFARRGRYELPGLFQQTLFPCGIWADLVSHELPRTIRVYPTWHPLERLELPQGATSIEGNDYPIMARGDSSEFLGVREYRAEDSVKAIHPKTWARLGYPAVKELMREHTARVCLLLDTYVPAPQPAARLDAFEAAISLTASVADCLSRQGYVLELFATGPGADSLQVEDSITEVENVLDILASLVHTSEAPGPGIFPSLVDRIRDIGIAIVVLLSWDEPRAAFVSELLEHGVAVKVVVVASDEREAGPTGAELLAAPDRVVVTTAQIREGISDL